MPSTLFSITAHCDETSVRLGRFEFVVFYGPHRPYPAMSPKHPGEILFDVGPLTIALLNHRRMDDHTAPASL